MADLIGARRGYTFLPGLHRIMRVPWFMDLLVA